MAVSDALLLGFDANAMIMSALNSSSTNSVVNIGTLQLTGTTLPTIDNSNFRLSTSVNGSMLVNSASAAGITLTLASATTSITLGFAYKRSTANTIQVASINLSSGSQAINITINAQMMLTATLANGTLLIANSTKIRPGLWYRIEMFVAISGSNVSLNLIVNGSVASASAVYTGGYYNITNCTLGTAASNSGQSVWYDDVFIDPTANLSGDLKVETFKPNGDYSVEWTRTGAGLTGNYQAVTSNTTSDYTSSATISNYDLFYANTPPAAMTGGLIMLIQFDIYALSSASGQICPFIDYTGTLPNVELLRNPVTGSTYSIGLTSSWVQYLVASASMQQVGGSTMAVALGATTPLGYIVTG